MASMVKFTVDPIDFEEAIKRRDKLAECTRHLYFIAARRIQAWIRGILTRNHFRLLHESSVIVQRHWRGYLARNRVDRYLVERVHQMWRDYYDEMATRIQAIWRGYWIRKTVRDIPKMRRWLQEVYAKNVETVENMKRFREEKIEHLQTALERESVQWILFVLFKLHHMLGTKQKPGVFTRIDNTRFTLIEEMLRCLEYKYYVRRKRMITRKKCRDCQIDKKPDFTLQGTYYERCEKEIRQFEKNIQEGVVPIYRSEPYEEQEKIIRKWNQLDLEAAIHGTLEMRPTREQKKRCGLIKEFEEEASCIPASKLYKKIEKMDCHLKRFCLRCPVHGAPSSS